MTDVSNVLQSELKHRFRRCTDLSDPDHGPLFLMATMLNSRYKVLLNQSPVRKRYLKKLMAIMETLGPLAVQLRLVIQWT